MIAARRLPGWERRVMGTINRAVRQRFAWGEFDCSIFAADCFFVVTGIDPAVPHFRGKYRDEAGAIAAMLSYSGGGPASVLERVSRDYCVPAVSRFRARAGDPVALDFKGKGILGVVDMSDRHAAVVTPRGLGRVPLDEHMTVLGIPG